MKRTTSAGAARSTRIRRLGTDGRVWTVTALLLGSYALGSVHPFTGADVLFAPVYAVMFVYYASVGLLFLQFGLVGFWVGFGLFCWVVAAALVSGWDRVRASAAEGDAASS